MTLARTGYGADTRTLRDRPNVVSITLGAALSPASPGPESAEVLETNIDDVTGEILGHVIAAALAAGTLDAWVTPAVMPCYGTPQPALTLLETRNYTDANRFASVVGG